MPIDRNIYFFGNSLVNYAEGGSQTNVPLWMDRFAGADGNGLAVEGGYGFLRDFADAETPNTDWGFNGVENVLNDGRTDFAEGSFDAIVITPANFIQEAQPFENYFDEPRSPLEATIEIVTNMGAVQPGARLFVYEGWADMGPYSGDGNPSPPALAAYHDYNQGEYHAWYEALVDITNAETGAEVTLIPVASILSQILTESPLSEIPTEDLYVDSAPHGTETTYFLAAMITYGAIYGEMPPPDFFVPEVVNPLVGAYFVDVNEDIAAALNAAGIPVRIPAPGDDTGFEGFLQGEGFGEGSSEGVEAEVFAREPETEPEPTFAEVESTVEEEPEEPIFEPPLPETEEELAQEIFDQPEEEAADAADPDADPPCFTRTLDSGDGGPFTFSLTSDDPAELYVSGELVLLNDGSDPGSSRDVTIDVPPGELELSVYYYEQDGGEILILDAGPAFANEIAGLPASAFEEEPEVFEEEALEAV